MSTTVTYPLRLPRSIKAAAEQLAKAEGVSLKRRRFSPNGATAPIWRPFAAS